VADPNYVLEDTTWNGVRISLLFVPEVRRSRARMREWAAEAMAYYCEHVGCYPYRPFAIAQAGEGGMEYPKLVILRGFDSLPLLAATTVHEMGHNWFYGWLGNNERREAWLDEGMTTFHEIHVMEHLFSRFGDISDGSTWYVKRLAREANDRDEVFRTYLTFAKFGYDEPILTPSDAFGERSDYGAQRVLQSRGDDVHGSWCS